MATIITIKWSDFSGKGFPIIQNLVSDGLQLAYRFKNSFENSISLSTEKLVLSGAPVFTGNSAICDNSNKLITENLTDKGSLTMLVAYRIHVVDGELRSYIFGSYPNNKGFSFFRGANTTPTQSFNLSATFYATNSSGARVQQTGLPGLPITFNDSKSDWDIVAVRFDMETNMYSHYNRNTGEWRTVVGGSDFTFVDTTSGSKIGIGSIRNSTSWKGQTEVAEVLIYNKALSDEQVLKQIGISTEYLKSIGID